jgi:hypothetical protein
MIECGREAGGGRRRMHNIEAAAELLDRIGVAAGVETAVRQCWRLSGRTSTGRASSATPGAWPACDEVLAGYRVDPCP